MSDINMVEFNEKWSDYLEDNHYGLDIQNPNVIEWLDEVFTDLKELGVEFKYYQIKLKFGWARFYSTLPHSIERAFESQINTLVKLTENEDE